MINKVVCHLIHKVLLRTISSPESQLEYTLVTCMTKNSCVIPKCFILFYFLFQSPGTSPQPSGDAVMYLTLHSRYEVPVFVGQPSEILISIHLTVLLLVMRTAVIPMKLFFLSVTVEFVSNKSEILPLIHSL